MWLSLYVLLKHMCEKWWLKYASVHKSLFLVGSLGDKGEFTKRIREMSSQLSVTLYTLSIYPSAHKQLRRDLPNPSPVAYSLMLRFGYRKAFLCQFRF